MLYRTLTKTYLKLFISLIFFYIYFGKNIHLAKQVFTFIFFSILFFCTKTKAQLAPCQNGLVYWNLSPIRIYDPSLPYNGGNPVNSTVPNGAGGLSYGPNLNGGPSPTYYTVISGIYNYWNGAAWVSTGHSASPSAVNLGHGPGCLYNLVGGSGNVYKYLGTGPDFLLVTVPGWGGGGPYDVVVDNCCNFYLLRTLAPQALWCFDPNGVLTTSCSLSNLPSSSAGGGFAIVGNQVVVGNGGGLWVGNISGGNVSFTNITTTITAYNDFASCPIDCGGPCGVPLPVTFSNFGGTNTATGNLLNWETESEINVSYFSIERATDAQHFEELTKISSAGKASRYEWTDTKPLNNLLNYYRIIAHQNNGEKIQTYVIHLQNNSGNMAASSIYPNPSKNEIALMLKSESPSLATINVYSYNGSLVLSLNKETYAGITAISFSIENFSAGIYLVEVVEANGLVVSRQKLVKSE